MAHRCTLRLRTSQCDGLTECVALDSESYRLINRAAISPHGNTTVKIKSACDDVDTTRTVTVERTGANSLHIGLAYAVTWRHRSRDDSNPHIGFPIGALLEPSPYLQAFSRYLAPYISGSRPWLFKVTWRHWSCDHLMPHIAFPIGVPFNRLSISSHFRDIGP